MESAPRSDSRFLAGLEASLTEPTSSAWEADEAAACSAFLRGGVNASSACLAASASEKAKGSPELVAAAASAARFWAARGASLSGFWLMSVSEATMSWLKAESVWGKGCGGCGGGWFSSDDCAFFDRLRREVAVVEVGSEPFLAAGSASAIATGA